MHPIPNLREDKAEDIARDTGHDDERHRRGEIKRLHDVRQVDHVHPEHEIDDCLRPPERDEDCPDKVLAADKRACGKGCLGGIEVMIHEIMLSD